MELTLFDEVSEVLRGLVPEELGQVRTQARRYGMKAWFGPVTPPRVHYEAQVIGATHVPGAQVLAVEVGFHAEHPKPADNDALLQRLLDAEPRWRPELGADAQPGPFLGRDGWQRLSETWPDPDLGDPELGIELAVRLAEYITALDPLLRRH